MFGVLENYKTKEFYKNNNIIQFYTLENEDTIKKEYEIYTVFKTTVYNDNSFKYYSYTDFENEEEFNTFIKKVEELKMYETGVKTEYGDKLITLSTCEYSNKNGRFVIVAKQI